MKTESIILETFKNFIDNEAFSCVAAKAGMRKGNIKIMIADHMACPKDDAAILNFLLNFTKVYRNATGGFYSAAVIFKSPELFSEEMFDTLLWKRLQSLSDMDANQNSYDKRVAIDPSSKNFSFSLNEEAFFIIGIHPKASRASRQFKYPALIFNPHAQFEALRKKNQFEKMKAIVRKKEMQYSGSINPNLRDFGLASEVYQYSGLQHSSEWKCPLHINHTKSNEIYQAKK